MDVEVKTENGVMIITPKVIDAKDGDIIVCGWQEGAKYCEWICILKGELDKEFCATYYIEDYCGMYLKRHSTKRKDIWFEPSNSDASTYVRFATNEEKVLFFDELRKIGFEWDSENKKIKPLRWIPDENEKVWIPVFNPSFTHIAMPLQTIYNERLKVNYSLGRVFENEKECIEFCDKINEVVNKYNPYNYGR